MFDNRNRAGRFAAVVRCTSSTFSSTLADLMMPAMWLSFADDLTGGHWGDDVVSTRGTSERDGQYNVCYGGDDRMIGVATS
jgi:hypothetical protein